MADASPEKSPQDGALVGWGDKKAVISGQNGLIIFLTAALIGMCFYTLEIQGDKLDKALAEHHKMETEESTKHLARHNMLVEQSTRHSVEVAELLRLTTRQVAALEIIAARVGTYIKPYQEQRYDPPAHQP